MNSQAKVFRIFKKEGMPGLQKRCENFIEAMKTASIDFCPIQIICKSISINGVKNGLSKDQVEAECINVLRQNMVLNADEVAKSLAAVYYDYYNNNTNQKYAKQKQGELKQQYENDTLENEK